MAEKLWRSQFPGTTRWRLKAAFKPDSHFSVMALARCEIQAIDQHWSLNRVAVSLPGGETDENLAREIVFAEISQASDQQITWPRADPAKWHPFLAHALETDLKQDLLSVVARQQNSLGRELQRVDDYFENYALELSSRSTRSTSENVRSKQADRLAAARAAHERRRADQIARHEIRVHPHVDALLLVCEPAWQVQLEVDRAHQSQRVTAQIIPRARRWEILS